MSPSVSPELFRALAVVCEDPPARARWPPVLGRRPRPADHTDLFSFQLPPYASIYLGAEGMLGGEPAGRVAGFWRALHLDPPAEPDHLAALLGLYAALTEAEEDETDPARRRLRGEARRALLAEHLAPWVPVYTIAANRVAGAGYRPWAEALSAAVLAEATAADLAGTARSLPLHLREAPPPAEPGDDGLDAYLGRVLAPVALRDRRHPPGPGRGRPAPRSGPTDGRAALRAVGIGDPGSRRRGRLAGRRGERLGGGTRPSRPRPGRHGLVLARAGPGHRSPPAPPPVDRLSRRLTSPERQPGGRTETISTLNCPLGAW